MISWLMDRLADRVNHGYWYAPDPSSIQNNHYGQWGQAKDNNMAIGISDPVNYGFLPQSVHTISTGAIGVSPGVLQNVTPQYPNGTIVAICFIDARGQNWALDVDPIYAQTMLQISQGHQMKAQYAYPTTYNATQAPPPIMVKPTSMIEGDFTEGEMELAENIIAELEGGDKKGSKQNIQEDIDCAA